MDRENFAVGVRECGSGIVRSGFVGSSEDIGLLG